MPQPPEKEIEVFNLAQDLPAQGRAEYLDKACAGDDALRQRIEELLKASEESCPCLENTLAVSPEAGGTIRVPIVSEVIVGERIGRYKLLQQIGQGGCGVVYMADQEEPVRRRVALKIIKLGMDTKQVVARFDAERQALAMMDHPNIAKVLDAAATDTGRPYFVMELVRGIPITSYCDENTLNTEERLRLFVQVCQAIQHAHQKGIIHRDLKPSNVLVGDLDGVPVPKIIDFGIAKATTGQRLTDQTLFTSFEQFIGTPAYMSPEQARMSTTDIDTRSDIYSLGVLLYELLTGRTPFEPKRLLESGLDEIRRIIREEEPPRPSTKLQTLTSADQTTVARCRRSEAPKLFHLVSGDLDWIVMKCLEKDRARRYETANGLAMDIQQHLSDEPIMARPPSRAYRFQKLVRRNKLAFGAATAVATAVIIGLGVSMWLLIRERAARERAVIAERAQSALRGEAEIARAHEAQLRAQADTEAAKSKQVSRFLEDMLKGVGPSVALGRDTTMLREILDKTTKRVGNDLTNQPAVEIELRTVIAETYLNLGEFKQAERVGREGLERSRSFYGEEDLATARLLVDLGVARYGLGEPDQLALMREGCAIQRKLLPGDHLEIANSLDKIAEVLRRYNGTSEAEATTREALEMKRRLFGNDNPVLIPSLNAHGWLLLDLDRVPESESDFEEALRLGQKLGSNQDPDTAITYRSLGQVFAREGKLDQGEAMLREAVAIEKRVLGSEHVQRAWTLYYLAIVLFNDGKIEEGEAAVQEALSMRKQLSSGDLSIMVGDFANVLFSAGRNTEAVALLAELSTINPKDTDVSLNVAILQLWYGEDAEYEATRRRLVQEAEGTDQAGTAERAAKAYCLRPSTNSSLSAKALDLARRAVELGKNKGFERYYQLCLGLAQYRNSQFALGEETMAKTEQILGAHLDDQGTYILGTARFFRVMCLFQQNRSEQARKLFAQAASEMPPFPKDERKPLLDGRPVFHELLICWLAYKEARDLLESPSVLAGKPGLSK